MRNYIIFLFLMLCSAAFPGEVILNGKELAGIKGIAEHVREGKIERVKIVKDKDGKYRLEIVYSSTRYSFCFDLNNDRTIENIIRNGVESVANLLKSGNDGSLKEITPFDIYRIREEKKEKNSYAYSKCNEWYFTEKLNVEDFVSQRRS